MEQYSLTKSKMLGNIKFIGELGKLEMLHEGILHKCIKQLVSRKPLHHHHSKSNRDEEMSQDLECLCQILRTIGALLDTPRAQNWMDQYFERIKIFRETPGLPPRIRFMLQDVVELRSNHWQPRKATLAEGAPTTIQQVRENIAKESGIFVPPAHMMPSPPYVPMDPFFGAGHHATYTPSYEAFSRPNRYPTFKLSNPRHRGQASEVNHQGHHQGQGSKQQFNSKHNSHDDRNHSEQQRYNKESKSISDASDGPSNKQYRDSSDGLTDRQVGRQKDARNHDTTNRELPPRFRKQLLEQPKLDQPMGTNQTRSQHNSYLAAPTHPPRLTHTNKKNKDGEINLRPAHSFTTHSRTVPSSNTHFSSQSSSNHVSANTFNHTNTSQHGAITRQQVTEVHVPTLDKKSTRGTTAPKSDPLKTIVAEIDTFLREGDMNGALGLVSAQTKVNKTFVADLLVRFFEIGAETADFERLDGLVEAMGREGVLNGEAFVKVVRVIVERLPTMEPGIPLLKSHVARLISLVIASDIVGVEEVAGPLVGGREYPLFLLCLQQLVKKKGEEWVLAKFQESGVNLQNMMPVEFTKERMDEVLDERVLSFLLPLQKLESDLWTQINADGRPSQFYRYIKDTVATKALQEQQIISCVVTTIIRYILFNSTLRPNGDPTENPSAEDIASENSLLDKFKGVLQKIILDKLEQQVTAIYALQVSSYNLHNPKGMLLRIFRTLCDLEVIYEDAFIRWKEEVNDMQPGKREALFQVNQWISTLEQADSDSEDD